MSNLMAWKQYFDFHVFAWFEEAIWLYIIDQYRDKSISNQKYEKEEKLSNIN